MKDGVLQVYANGEFTYRLRDIYAHSFGGWDFETSAGGDTHFSVMRGTKANLIIRQGAEQKFKPVLYIENTSDADTSTFGTTLKNAIAVLQDKYPGVGFQREGKVWRVIVPDKYDVGHEAHFAQVTENFLDYLRDGKLPDWEIPDMITKYATIMQAYQLSR